jgi:hypothetical protein
VRLTPDQTVVGYLWSYSRGPIGTAGSSRHRTWHAAPRQQSVLPRQLSAPKRSNVAPSAVNRPHHPANWYTPNNIISAPAATTAGLIYFSSIALTSEAQSSRLAVFGGRGMSFNICRGTLGSLAMFTAIRNASSRDSRFAVERRPGSGEMRIECRSNTTVRLRDGRCAGQAEAVLDPSETLGAHCAIGF